jgi:hypothetical protein
MINASQPRYGIDRVLVISVKRLLPVELRGIAAALGRPKSARPCRPDELRRRSQTPQLSRPGSVRAMAGLGHQERFSPPKLNAGCGLTKETFAGLSHNEEDAFQRPMSVGRKGRSYRGLDEALNPFRSSQ